MADTLGIGLPYLERWIEEGLPEVDGLVDPFLVSNWVTWNHLADVPALMRRWQNFLNWFFPFVQGQDGARAFTWQRRQKLHLPHSVVHLRWTMPRVVHETGVQEITRQTPMKSHGEGTLAMAGLMRLAAWREAGAFWRLDQDQAPPGLEARQTVEVIRWPQAVLDPADSEHAAILAILEPMVADFRYGYRQHLIVDDLERARERYPDGSCLDCALVAAGLLADAGWATRLCGGIIAHSLIANPHFWIEVHSAKGWAPVDPSLPAIARMLKLPWRNWLARYIGACDARRILLSRGDGRFPGLPQCNYISGSSGGAAVAGADGVWRHAWACIDWVCGQCNDSFDSQMLE
jgi:hypothetical protein